MVHVTGGGFYENLPRMYSCPEKKLISVIKKGSWEQPAIFAELVRRGANPDRMFNTFNMGIGFVLAVAKDKADEVLAQLSTQEIPAWKIGKVAQAEKEVSSQEEAVIFE